MVFYLFRPRASLNGIPLPSSAHYRLWIQPQSRPLARNSGNSQRWNQHAVPAQVPTSFLSR
jgi:hypothetical protein